MLSIDDLRYYIAYIQGKFKPISRRQIHNYVNLGLPSHKIGWNRLFKEREVRKWFKSYKKM